MNIQLFQMKNISNNIHKKIFNINNLKHVENIFKY